MSEIVAKTYTLMTPGPVPVPDEVLAILAKPMEHHRTPEFVQLFGRVLVNLKKVFMTEQPAFILTSTGTGGMEAAIVNTLSPGDRVIAVVSGKFGERWADIAEANGAMVERINVPWGQVVDVHEIDRLLKKFPETVAVLTQACETSTGVLHPVREIAQLTSKTKTVVMVDAITALGALPLPMDEWGIDVMVGGSQKAFMLPTGLAFISLSKKAWALTETSKCRKFYFDLRKEKAANDNGESGWSAAVTHIRALDLVLDLFLKQGLHRVHSRIQALSQATIEGARLMGLEIFPVVPSPSLTTIRVPDGVDGQKLRGDMEKESAVIVMGGQDQLKGKVIRVGHMGAIRDEDLLITMDAIAKSLNNLKPGTIDELQITRARTRMQEILKAAPAVVLKDV